MIKRTGNQSMLGIALEGRRLYACVVRRRGGVLEARPALQASLTLDPLAAAPELAGRELRSLLDRAGIGRRPCMVAVPVSWVFSLSLRLPELTAEDEASYIALQAERGFPHSVEDLNLAVARWREPEGGARATVLAMPRARVEALEAVLRAAGLKPLGISLGLTALLAPGWEPIAVLRLTRQASELLVGCDGAPAIVRSFDCREGSDPLDRDLDRDPEALARELRITLAQLSPGVRLGLRELLLVPEPAMNEELVLDLCEALGPLGLAIRVARPGEQLEIQWNGAPTAGAAAAAAIAAGALEGKPPTLQFLPPRESRWRRLGRRVSARRALWAGGLGLVLAAAGLGALGWQHQRLARLEARWAAIEPRVTRVEQTQEQIRRYRSWYDDTAPNLRIALALTEAFPEEGAVWAQQVSIKRRARPPAPAPGGARRRAPAAAVAPRGLASIECRGRARSSADWLEVLGTLRADATVADLQIMQALGEAPLQFQFSYAWKGEEGR